MFARLATVTLLLAVVLAVAARSSFGGSHPQAYRVKQYDTLWSIATSHYSGDPRAAIWKIERRNHLDGETLVPGETLQLP